MPSVTVVIPAYNEGRAIRGVLEKARSVLNDAGIDAELMVVVDGASDNTASEATAVADTVLEHPQNMGYGRTLKTGITAAKHDLIAIADADGTYPVERLPEMIQLAERFHMVVGARTGAFYQGGWVKRVGRFVFRHLSEFAAGQRIPDINSGLRVFRRGEIMPFFSVISAGFSFTTTSTLVYLLNDMFVHYIPIEYREREGNSKVRHVRDSLRALQIIVEAILRCNPIKIFLLLAFPFFAGAALSIFIALFAQHVFWLLCGMMFLCTGSIVLSMGCLAVSTMTRRRMSEDVHREARPTLERAAITPLPNEPADLATRFNDDG
ncbi:Undecaprenyl-phosphate 4-deoxy-4-formamido-L-arabinose transferase [Planctomycetes bacterium K23_9]|uniref:Undecaprenyl-phosphate 4-deoxy-4-formamido-L-arabinose transferase n=2 Tax=Stieleria marina TaxID=1930275 RepID=A0A517NN64_9BACT|nr:Undecaprenyl-phosphate 4-deoxy-4-formamido-L-arabinose transferase [Planctomycetes bacterium K23_9]